MPADVFISYSRRNRAFAEQLHHDLTRAGLTVWRDASDIPTHSAAWWDEIRAAIIGAAHVVLLVSPESVGSDVVGRELEVAVANGKPIHRLLVGGEYGDLPPEWRVSQVTRFRDDYHAGLRLLLGALGAPRRDVRSLTDLASGPAMTVEDAARELGPERTVPFWSGGRAFRGLPIEPSGYTMAWLIGPADANLRPFGQLAVLFGFTGKPGSGDAQEVLDHWSAGGGAWLLWFDGPVNSETGRRELWGGHAWRDAMDAAERVLARFGKGRVLDLFLACPVALAFAVGARLRQMSTYRLHNYRRGRADGDAAYEMVLELGSSP